MNATPIEYKKRQRRKIKPRKTLEHEVEHTIKQLMVTLAIIIVGLGIVFLSTTSKATQKGYTLEQQKLQNEQLKTFNSDLSHQITNATKFSKIEESEKIETMEEREPATYVTKEDNEVK